MTRAVRSLLLCCPLAASLACGDSPVSPSYITGSFKGPPGARANPYHSFTVSADGYVDITVADLAPNVVVGSGVGTESSGTCVLVAADDSVTKGDVLEIGLTKGTYCVELHDVGNVTVPVAYTLTVYHP